MSDGITQGHEMTEQQNELNEALRKVIEYLHGGEPPELPENLIPHNMKKDDVPKLLHRLRSGDTTYWRKFLATVIEAHPDWEIFNELRLVSPLRRLLFSTAFRCNDRTIYISSWDSEHYLRKHLNGGTIPSLLQLDCLRVNFD